MRDGRSTEVGDSSRFAPRSIGGGWKPAVCAGQRLAMKVDLDAAFDHGKERLQALVQERKTIQWCPVGEEISRYHRA